MPQSDANNGPDLFENESDRKNTAGRVKGGFKEV
jgi:hypothetical protein